MGAGQTLALAQKVWPGQPRLQRYAQHCGQVAAVGSFI